MAVLILAGTHAVTVPWIVWLGALVATAGGGALAQWIVSAQTRRAKAVRALTALVPLVVIVWDCGAWWGWGCWIF